MNRLQLQNLVLSWVDDLQGGYFTPPQVQAYLNLGQQKVQKKLIQSGELWWTKFVDANCIQNITVYELPEDFMKLHKFEIVVSGTFPNQDIRLLYPITPTQENYFPNGTGIPDCYWLRKNAIQLVKCPDNNYTMQLLYSYQVPDLTADGQVPEIPDRYQEGIAVEAALECFLKDQRDPTPFVIAKQKEFNEDLTRDAQERNVDQARFVNMNDAGGSYQDW